MRLSQSIIIAGVLFVAAPALAQDNSAANGTANAAASNAAVAAPAPPNETLTGQANASANGPATAALPPGEYPVQTAPQPHTFPWGVIGLIGLLGLLGVRKVKG